MWISSWVMYDTNDKECFFINSADLNPCKTSVNTQVYTLNQSLLEDSLLVKCRTYFKKMNLDLFNITQGVGISKLTRSLCPAHLCLRLEAPGYISQLLQPSLCPNCLRLSCTVGNVAARIWRMCGLKKESLWFCYSDFVSFFFSVHCESDSVAGTSWS